MPDQPAQHMQCMEVWGGSQLTSRSVEFGGLDAWVYSKPYGQAHAGGDIYYASSCATGRISRLLLADVAGHGQTVAATAADLRTLMRRFVNRLDQTEFVRLLNQQFAALPRTGAFATAIVTTFFEPSRRLTICNAGHPRPLLYRATERQWDVLGSQEPGSRSAPSNIPLGLFDGAEYEQFDLQLEPNDCLLSFTDALIESRDADGEMLGEDGLLRIVRVLRATKADRDAAGRNRTALPGKSIRRRCHRTGGSRKRPPAPIFLARKVRSTGTLYKGADAWRARALPGRQSRQYRRRHHSRASPPLARTALTALPLLSLHSCAEESIQLSKGSSVIESRKASFFGNGLGRPDEPAPGRPRH
jgi:phosphoserine phosphatase RsbU/P